VRRVPGRCGYNDRNNARLHHGRQCHVMSLTRFSLNR
jgi:hypothetical protein